MLGNRIRLALIGLTLPVLASIALAQRTDYTGHRVVRVSVETKEDVDRLLTMTDDVWSHELIDGKLDVRVTPEQYDKLRDSRLAFDELIADVQVLIDREARGSPGRGTWDNYMDLAAVNAYVDTLIALRPDLAQLINIGTTIEGRPIRGLRITGAGGGTKPGILYWGGQHAREWITVPVVLYFADKLIREYDTDGGIRELVDRCEWFIIPVMNPDGYSYTWTNQRLWRKNRRDNGDGTFGVDLNRNWGGAGWGGAGSSGSTSNETYRGTAPFSEPETQAMRDVLLNHPNIVAMNDIHSYSQLILWPFGYKAELPANQAEYEEVGQTIAQIIVGVHGMNYDPGNIYHILYQASGCSVDYAHEELGKLALSYELRDTGQYGFVLPPEQILPTCEEIFPTLIYLADHATAAVRIEFPGGLPTLIAPGAATDLAVRITAGAQGVDPNGATLHVRTSPAGPTYVYPITHLGGDDFLARFPARDCGPDTQFYVRAQGDAGGASYSPPGGGAALYSVPVGTLSVAFADDFESDLGWTVQNTNLSTGAWVRVDPNGTAAQPENDNPAGTGTMCYVTGQGSVGGSVGEADVDGGPTQLLSPLLDLSGQDPTVSYYRWLYNDDGDDTLVTEVSNNNGTTWTTAEVTGHDPAWVRHEFRLADLVAPTAQVRLRFTTSDNPNNSITEGGIDDVVVSTRSCASVRVPGDMNCDGSTNGQDIEGFVLALADPSQYGIAHPDCLLENADANGDGSVNGFDVATFVELLLGP